jgi:beta-lactamase class D
MTGRPVVFLVILFIISSCSRNNVTIDDSLSKYFDSAGVSGSFGLFDNTLGHFTIYNLPRYRDSAYMPAGTFDIVSSLVGIQTGVVKDDSSVDPLPAGGSGDHPLTLKEAFRNSGEEAFGALERRIGRDTLKKWVDSLGYGNKDLSEPVDSFRMDDQLRITADEELGLVKKLYFDQLPFFQRTQRIVRGMMLMESNSNYQLSYETCLGRARDGRFIGWVVGWIEENKHPYFFVLNLGSGDLRAVMPDVRMAILRNILKQLGFFEGKK